MNNKIKKSVIITGYRCNNMCDFCIDEDKRDLPNKSTKEIMAEMLDARRRGTTYIELIGGEVFIRPDALRLIDYASKLGFDTINIATNGRMLAYKDFARKVVDAGLTDIIFSVHGASSEIHDKLTKSPGSFEQLLQGFKNIKNTGKIKSIGSNTTIVKGNYKHLEEIGKFIYDLGIRNSEFIFVDPNYGAAKTRFESIVPRISKISPYVHRCLDIGKENKVPHWHIRYVPLCYFTDYLEQISELQEVATFETEHLAPDFQNMNVEESRASVGREKTDRCLDCALYEKCEGIWKEYVRVYGDKELSKIKS